MKKSTSALTVLALTLSVSSAFACSPAPRAIMDLSNINRALSSSAFNTELNHVMSSDFSVAIKSVKAGRGVLVALSNGCTITVSTSYKPVVHNGMCPQVDTISAETTCVE